MRPEPYTINVPQATLDELKERLKHTRFPNKSQDAGWNNGTDLSYMKDLVDYWQHTYDWRKAEAEINSFDNYKVTIDGVEIHFIHQKSDTPNAKAIIMTHGWPDSFYRFHNVIPELAKNYDVIVPSMPGFGFSTPRAMSAKKIADLWAKLMTDVLGYDSFLATGGDKGADVTIALARNHKDTVKAIHLTDVGWSSAQPDPSTLTEAEKQFVDQTGKWYMTEGAYTMMHATKPLTVAYGVNDSPVGLAAWAASFANGGTEQNHVDAAFGDRDAFLTNMTIYWVTETAGSAMQMYREDIIESMSGGWGAPSQPAKIDVPTAIAVFPYDAIFPKEWAERQGLNVQRYTIMSKGGHFAPLEVPKLFAQEVEESFRQLTE